MHIVRLVNTSDAVWTDMYDSQTYVIQPKSEGLVPIDAACLWLGDPATRDLDQRNRLRTDEYRRIRARYGVYEYEAEWDARRPQLECYELDGTRLPMVADDPHGEGLTVVTDEAASNSDVALLQAAFIQSQEQLKLMEEKIHALMASNPPASEPLPLPADSTLNPPADLTSGPSSSDTTSEPILPVDDPQKVPVGQRDSSSVIVG